MLGICTTRDHSVQRFLIASGGLLFAAASTDQEQKNPVEWATGVRIALGIARALAYIHHSCKPQIVHRDISATNVLLDENLVPHLSDFGMAKLMENGDTDVTGTVAGTFGYISPGKEYVLDHDLDILDRQSTSYFILKILEFYNANNCPHEILEVHGVSVLWMKMVDSAVVFASTEQFLWVMWGAEYAKTGKATDKLDVYSYGVLLLEIISGRRPTDSSIPEEHVNLASWVHSTPCTHVLNNCSVCIDCPKSQTLSTIFGFADRNPLLISGSKAARNR